MNFATPKQNNVKEEKTIPMAPSKSSKRVRSDDENQGKAPTCLKKLKLTGTTGSEEKRSEEETRSEEEKSLLTKLSWSTNCVLSNHLKGDKYNMDLFIISHLLSVFCSNPSVWVVAVTYFVKLINLKKLSENVRNDLVACLLLATKYLEDDHFDNLHYAQKTDLTLQEINQLEESTLKNLDYDMGLSIKVYKQVFKNLTQTHFEQCPECSFVCKENTHTILAKFLSKMLGLF